LEEHENFNTELQRSRGSAIAVRGRRCMGRLLLREVFNATDRTSGPVICSYMTGWGSQGQETIVDRSTDLASGYFSFSSTWCRSLLL